METTHPPFKYHSIMIILLIICLTICQVNSELYAVGDDGRWDTGTNYVAWSQNHNFSAGDVLVFNYVQGQHNVYEVTEDTYRSCDASVGVINIYVSGNDRVALKEAKKYWFICNVPGHCLGGMKFGVEVTNGSSEGTPETPPVGDASAQGRMTAWWVWAIAFGILATFHLIFHRQIRLNI